MIPRTYPSILEGGKTKCVVYPLSSVTGLQAWKDYIPVKGISVENTAVENTYANDGYIVMKTVTTGTAWVDYIPVYQDNTLTKAWSTDIGGYIPASGLFSIAGSLFGNGEQGAWYDPSDLTTLFQDAAGTTPVTAVEQPVGLMLDKSGGLNPATEGGQMVGVSGSGFDTPSATANQITGDIDIRVRASLVSWASANTVFCSRVLTGASSADSYEFWISSTGFLRFLTVSGTTATDVASSAAVGFAAGTTNWVRVTWKQSTGFVNFYTSSDGVTWTQNGTANRAGTTAATNAGSRILRIGARTEGSFPLNGKIYRAQIYNGINGTLAVDFNPTLYSSGATFTAATGEVWTITGSNARIVPDGNHAFQSTSASRPVLSARVNLLTGTDGFTGATITPATGLVVVATGLLDPRGGNTARQIRNTTTTEQHRLFVGTTASGRPLYSVEVKNVDAGFVQLSCNGTVAGAFGATFNLVSKTVTLVGVTPPTATITEIENGFLRLSVLAPAAETAVTNVQLYVLEADNNTPNPTTTGTAKSVIIAGADLRASNDGVGLPAYQRVNTSTDYDTTGFPLYIKPNGSTQWMQTNSINFSATDKMTVFAGVRKLSDAATAMIAELSAGASAGRFFLAGPIAAESVSYRFESAGTAFGAASSVGQAAPITNVLTGQGNISGDSAILRVNGTQVGTSSADQGTGNYGNYPLYLFARNGTSLWFGGRFYGLVVRGAASDASLIANTEAFMNTKTKAY